MGGQAPKSSAQWPSTLRIWLGILLLGGSRRRWPTCGSTTKMERERPQTTVMGK